MQGSTYTDMTGSLRALAQEATDSPWQHDLHETVNAPGAPAHAVQPVHAPVQQPHMQQIARAPAAHTPKPPQTRNFSTTVHTHNALVRIFLPQMKAPILFQNVPIKQHTRLPNHRPPLRRDKPVRISLPPSAPRYIFPTVERSFIFIPRSWAWAIWFLRSWDLEQAYKLVWRQRLLSQRGHEQTFLHGS